MNKMLVYKACQSSIVTLKLLPDSVTNESRNNVYDVNFAKFRTNKAEVVSIENLFTGNAMDSDCSLSFSVFKYKVGEIVETRFNENLNQVCASGIHYFKTREAAKCYGLCAWSRSNVEYYDNGAKCREFAWKEGKYLGKFKRWHDNGILALESFYNNDGKLDGLYQEFYRNGIISIKCNYENGERCGIRELYSDSGKLVGRCNYENGTLEGIHEIYFESGELTERCPYKNGLKHGKYESWDKYGNKTERYYYHGKISANDR